MPGTIFGKIYGVVAYNTHFACHFGFAFTAQWEGIHPITVNPLLSQNVVTDRRGHQFPRQPPRKLSFCLGRRIKRPQIDNLWRFLTKNRKCSPYGKSTTLHQSTRRHGVSEGPAPARKSRNCPFRTPPSVRYRPRVAGPSAAFVRGSAQRRIPRDTAKRHGPPPGALPRLI